jgi:hypothetical protein
MDETERRHVARRSDGAARAPHITSKRAWPVIFVVGLLPSLTWLAEFRSTEQQVFMIAYLALLCLGCSMSLVPAVRPVLLVTSIFQYCWLYLPAAYQVANTRAAWHDDSVVAQTVFVTEALIILAVAQLCLVLGYLVASATRDSPYARRTRSATNVAGLFRYAALASVVSTLLAPLVIVLVGGLGNQFASRSVRTDYLTNSGATASESGVQVLVRVIPGSLALFSVLVGILLLRSAPSDAGRGRYWLLVGWSSALAFLYYNPFTASRFLFLFAFGSLFLVAAKPRTTGKGLLLSALLVVAFLFFYPLANYFRAGQGEQTRGWAVLATNDFDGFQQVINTVSYVTARGYTDGIHILSALLFFVPRSIWSGKASPASIDVAAARGYTFTDLSLPLPAEIYLDLGWVGVLGVMLLIGYVFGRLDWHWVKDTPLSVLAGFFAFASVGMYRGPLGSLFITYAPAAILLYLALQVPRRRQAAHTRRTQYLPEGSHQ